MNIPEFTAEASLYRTSNCYRSSGSELGGSPYTQSVVAAYFPGDETQGKCSDCLEGCATTNASCNVIALATVWNPIAAAAAYAACATEAALCVGWCENPIWGKCCPKLCGVPNPFDPGSGCCDHGEACVDQNDPNSRNGCCPSDQRVCAGKCCPPNYHCCGDTCCPEGESCCGDMCCPPKYYCCGDTCCPPNYYCRDDGSGGKFCSDVPYNFPNTPPPPPLPHTCPPGAEPCGLPDRSGVIWTCCPPGLKCCDVDSNGQPVCRTTCIA